MNVLFLFFLILLILFLVSLIFYGLKKAVFFALNSLIGFFALYAVQHYWLHTLKINFLSVIITAIFGFIGFLITIILHLFGVAF